MVKIETVKLHRYRAYTEERGERRVIASGHDKDTVLEMAQEYDANVASSLEFVYVVDERSQTTIWSGGI